MRRAGFEPADAMAAAVRAILGTLMHSPLCRRLAYFHITLLALALAGCQTIKPLPPTGRVIPCSTVAPVNINEEAIDHLSERAARQLLGNDRVISELCARKK